MEISNTESNQASSPRLSEHETNANGDLEVHSSPAAAAENDDNQNLVSSSSSSSSSSSPKSPPKSTPFQTVEVKEDDELASGYSTEDNELGNSSPLVESPDTEVVSVSTLSPCFMLDSANNDSHSDNEMPTVSPPTQVMEREPSKYRIPSSVFARTKSNSPVDWSVASNDSLFSIQMGNMSFIKDDLFWKSGELGMKSGELDMRYGGGDLGMRSGELDIRHGEHATSTFPTEPSKSSQMFSYSQPLNTETMDLRKSVELAVETMKEVLRECADEDHKYEKSVSGGRIVRNSDGSTSTKSFAFSAGVDKSNSLATGSGSKSEKSTNKVQSQPSTPKEPKSPTQATPEVAAKTGWFSWFPSSCRPFC